MSRSSSAPRNRVLLVDADVRTSRRLAALLTEDGFQVELAPSGDRAVARLAQTPALGAVVTELTLPRVDGAAVVRFARAQNPRMRVVVLTRHPQLVKAADLGGPAPVVLTKPLDYEQLLQLLRHAPLLESARP